MPLKTWEEVWMLEEPLLVPELESLLVPELESLLAPELELISV